MNPTILVVDDDTSNLASLVKVFERLSVRVLPATNGQEALDTLRSKSVEIVLTDLMMPNMSGVDLLKHVRDISPDTEVILMTAYGTIGSRRSDERGSLRFVTKPFRRARSSGS